MTVKGLDRRALLTGLVLAAMAAVRAEAQLVDGQWRVFQPQQAPRIGVQVNTPTVLAQQAFNPIVAPRQPVQFTYVPTVVMSDGTVYGNYGYGYQQVVTCGPAAVTPYAVYGTGTGVVYGGSGSRGVPGASGAMPPAPNQQTRSQQMVAQNAQSQNAQFGGQVVQSPCAQQVTPAPTPAVGRRY